jgi:thiol-disulfide isomerase/thioredoxin
MSRINLKHTWAIAFGWLTLPILFCTIVAAQKPASSTPGSALAKSPAVEKIDEKRFAELIKPSGKPLLINFWATWCEPCREEFPVFVKIDAEYKGKIDFITVSLDFEEELKTGVPKFLAAMKATMPTYLLVTPDETAAISMVSKDWAGGLPFTVLYEPGGKISYFRQGLVRHDILQKEIDKLLASPAPTAEVIVDKIVDLPLSNHRFVELLLPSLKKTADEGIADAQRDLQEGKARVFDYGLKPGTAGSNNDQALMKKYGVGFRRSGCFTPFEGDAYATAYNRTVLTALNAKHGEKISQIYSSANQ